MFFDKEWRFVYVNDRAVQAARKTREELLGKKLWDLFPENVDTPYYHELHRAVRE